MNDDFAPGFVLGMVLMLFVMGFVLLVTNVPPGTIHHVGWDHRICVTSTDRALPNGSTTSTEHCATGEEFAKWAQEKER